jgi:hypothetical protein
MVTNGFHNPAGVTAGSPGSLFPGGVSTGTLGWIEHDGVDRERPRFHRR